MLYVLNGGERVYHIDMRRVIRTYGNDLGEIIVVAVQVK